MIDHVLHGPPVPVPSYGFDLVPVGAHSLRARRRRWTRQAFVLLAVAWVAYLASWAATIWAVVLTAALLMRWSASRAARKQNEGKSPSRPARSPRLAYAALCVPWLLALLPSGPLSGDGLPALRLRLVLLPFVALLATAVVFAGDRLAARTALAVLRRDGVSADRLPWTGPRAGRRLSDIGRHQTWQALPYDTAEHFIGAGRDAWWPAHINIRLTPKDPEGSVRHFGEMELLDRVGTALDELGRGAREITQPLPGFSMERVVGLPADMWLHRTRAAKRELPDLRGLGRKSPSSVPDRLYLRAQCITWDGQVVVSVFVHAALEAGELRLTVRPHVMTPLYNELRVTAAPANLRRMRLAGWLATQSLLDAAAGPAALWRLAARTGKPSEGRAEEKDPVSLRDRYSTEEVTDMHQSDDAKRHVVLMQSCVFRAVADYLRQQGVDTTAYEQQVAVVINNILVYGDNNAPIQNVAGTGISGVGQDQTNHGGK
ncbi:hypothetical protein ABZ883_42160 [Streptomyces sp. NPDC046977]|uniref:hypothetical protein n=1 Tax=Streptomyces sp. NPDC046977 TaxID=3154703 RepID=UPI0033FD895E